MASSRVETQITWSSAASVTLASATAYSRSDVVTLDAEDWEAALQVSVDNAGTPASGDVAYIYVAYSSGDLLGDAGNDYDTDEHAVFLGVLNTYGTDNPGEDPARKTMLLPTLAPGAFQMLALAPQSATRNLVLRARLVTHRVQ